MTTRKFTHRFFKRHTLSDRIESEPDLPPEEAALARDLLTLAQTIQPDPNFVVYLEGQLRRKRLHSHPVSIRQNLVNRMRTVLQSAWGWTLPAAVLILLIIVISLLVQLRPQPVLPSAVDTDTPTTQPTQTVFPAPLPPPTLEPTLPPSPTPTPLTLQAQDLALNPEDLGEGWALDAEKADMDAEYFLNRSENGKAVIWLVSQGYPFPLDPARVASINMRGFSQPQEGLVLFQVIVLFQETAQAEEAMQVFLPGCEVPCESVSIYGDGSGDRSVARSVAIGDQAMVASLGGTLESYFPMLTYLTFRQGSALVSTFSIGDFNDLDNGPPVDEARLEALARIVEARLVAAGIPASAATAEGSEATLSATPTPSYVNQPLLAKLQNLIQHRRTELLNGSGWIYVESDRTNTEQGGQMLPNGRQVPPQYLEYSWYQVDQQGNLLAAITRQIDYSEQIYQEIVTRDGISRNMTFSYEYTATLPMAYETDGGFTVAAGEALARGATLSQVENEEGRFVLLLEEEDAQRGGKLRRYAAFDPQTGRLLELSTWLDVPCEDVSEYECGAGQVEGMILLVEQWVDQPPADVLALFNQPLPEYQPLPPQGEPVPVDFDLAHSRLSFQTFVGDDFFNPTFWYGDIYADNSYLVGRVDFGAITGGFCQRSPDGMKLAFDRATLPSDAPATHQLRWLELNSPAEVHTTLPELQLTSPPVWNPSSDSLAFSACDANQTCSLYSYNTLSGLIKHLSDGGNATPPVWSPDGSQIAYQTGSDELPRTVVVDAASGNNITSPSWQPQFLADWSGYSQCELTPALAPTLPGAPDDWLKYTNPTNGFTFRYPPDATLEETSNTVLVRQYDQQGGALVLDIGFLRLGEVAEVRNGWLNMGDMGDLIHGGHISLLGQSLTRLVLVHEGKAKAILYGQVGRGGMIFSFRLDDYGQDYEVIDLSVELQQEVDQIIESFAWLP